jgi:hypothetical protein
LRSSKGSTQSNRWLRFRSLRDRMNTCMIVNIHLSAVVATPVGSMLLLDLLAIVGLARKATTLIQSRLLGYNPEKGKQNGRICRFQGESTPYRGIQITRWGGKPDGDLCGAQLRQVPIRKRSLVHAENHPSSFLSFWLFMRHLSISLWYLECAP